MLQRIIKKKKKKRKKKLYHIHIIYYQTWIIIHSFYIKKITLFFIDSKKRKRNKKNQNNANMFINIQIKWMNVSSFFDLFFCFFVNCCIIFLCSSNFCCNGSVIICLGLFLFFLIMWMSEYLDCGYCFFFCFVFLCDHNLSQYVTQFIHIYKNILVG